jgi:hypothetical protein
MAKKTEKKLITEKEADFIRAFCGKDSPTRYNLRASAVVAGYTERMALWNAKRLIKKWSAKGFRENVENLGGSNPALAMKFMEALEAANGKDAWQGLRLALANRGEQTDSTSIQKLTVNMPTMLIRGYTEERRQALIGGGNRQLARSEDQTPELLAPAEEDVIEVEAAAALPEHTPEPVQPKPASPVVEDARRLSAADFTGENLRRRK